MMRNLVCSECGGVLQEGHIGDNLNGLGTLLNILYWVEGMPKRSLVWGGWKVNGKPKHYLTAYRCEQCGFIKLYAGSDNLNLTK